MKQPGFMIISALMLILALPMMLIGMDLARIYHVLWLAPVPTMLCVITAGICAYLAENY